MDKKRSFDESTLAKLARPLIVKPIGAGTRIRLLQREFKGGVGGVGIKCRYNRGPLTRKQTNRQTLKGKETKKEK